MSIRQVLRSILCIVLLSAAAGMWGVRVQVRASSPLLLHYLIDRSAVPDWVTYRDLTLRFDVGDAEMVRAWGDGEPLNVDHDRRWGNAIVTTGASDVVLSLQGDDLDPSAVGDVVVAKLRDDKLWAFSLTFDDGQLSVYQYAYPELSRYGYRAGVAAIGLWLDRDDGPSYGYCRSDELQELINGGWSIFNHSYNHYAAESDISFGDAMQCQQAIESNLNGYRATVFTAPHVSSLWQDVIDNNTEALGLYLLQLRSDTGATLLPVDAPVTLGDRAFHLGRADIKNWSKDGYNYLDQAHTLAMTGEQRHIWLSMHGHSVLYDEDWCAVSDAASYLYYTYGEGGSDEVWVAPADEVFHYLVTRSYASVIRTDEAIPEPVRNAPPDEWITYRQGVNGYAGWSDTHIQVWYPSRNNGSQGQMVLWASAADRSSLLLRAELIPPVAGAQVLRATLSLYELSYSNNASVDIALYPLLMPWTEAETTWYRAMSGVWWNTAGARSPGLDRALYPEDGLHEGGCESAPRWYLYDITESAQRWVADPAQNYGVILEGSDEVSKGLYLASSEYPDLSLRPTLRVLWRYPEPEPTPEPGRLVGQVWEDSNANALRDAGEAALSGVTVELWDAEEYSLGHRQSDGLGEFTFDNLSPGAYTIAQYPLPGYTLTTAGVYSVTVSPRLDSQVIFGNRAVPTIQPPGPIFLPILRSDRNL
jgi:hypothetical protein